MLPAAKLKTFDFLKNRPGYMVKCRPVLFVRTMVCKLSFYSMTDNTNSNSSIKNGHTDADLVVGAGAARPRVSDTVHNYA